MIPKIITQNRLKKLLHYDPDTGIFTWLASNSNFVKVGDIAGWPDKGYIRICIDNRPYYAHRLAFLYMTDLFPPDQVDHINHMRSDNHWNNLRQADSTINNMNQPLLNTNTSGHAGVSWERRYRKWVARIQVNGKLIHLGYFATKFAAVYARHAANIKYGFHPNHGRF